MDPAMVILLAAGAYVGAGLVFGAAFVLRGVGRVDEAARHAPMGFRLVILPGAVALWPWLLAKWLRAGAEKGRT